MMPGRGTHATRSVGELRSHAEHGNEDICSAWERGYMLRMGTRNGLEQGNEDNPSFYQPCIQPIGVV